jgi:hypothetical protein
MQGIHQALLFSGVFDQSSDVGQQVGLIEAVVLREASGAQAVNPGLAAVVLRA